MSDSSVMFVRQGSKELEHLESVLTARRRRCNMMMVKSAEQAEAILRRECAGGAPDLVVVWGGASDSRAGRLIQTIRGCPVLSKTHFVILADDSTPEDAARIAGGPVGELSLPDVEKRLADDSFWWVVVRFGA